MTPSEQQARKANANPLGIRLENESESAYDSLSRRTLLPVHVDSG